MKTLADTTKLGNMILRSRLVLAPMAGSTEKVFRGICSRMGAALTVTELVSARGVIHDEAFARNHRFLNLGDEERPVLIQLFGADPEDMRRAVRRILSHPLYGRCSGIDVNMGCPVDKVVKTGAGAALMKTPELAAELMQAVAEEAHACGKTASAKFRSGWDETSVIAPEFASRLEKAGADFLCLHARTRQQMYSGKAGRAVIGETARALSIPLIANGDISERQDAQYILNTLGAEALMIGRAAVGNPWIFKCLLEGREVRRAEGSELSSVMREHLCGLMNELGESTGIREFRPALSAYIKGREGAAAARRGLMQIDDREVLLRFIHDLGHSGE